MRLFIGIDVGELIKNAAMRAQSLVEHDVRGVRWVQPANMHLSLKYLGNSPDEIVPRVAAQIKIALAGISEFSCETTGFGAFPSQKRARVLWLGVAKQDMLDKVQDLIEKAVKKLGFAAETRDFHPHITIGRLKNPRSIDLAKVDEEIESEFIIKIKEIILYASHLSNTGVRYEVLDKIELIG